LRQIGAPIRQQAACLKAQGHSKNTAGYGIDGVGSIFAEIFARGWDWASEATDHPDGGVAQRGELTGAGARAAAVLVHGNVAHMVELVFDSPMVADQFQQPFGASVAGGEARNQINDFKALFAADPARAFEPGDLAKTRPVEMGDGFRADRDGARLDPAVGLFERSGIGKIGRGTIEAALGVRGGKDRRTLRRCQLSARAGCL
jgi:hypothetical protein